MDVLPKGEVVGEERYKNLFSLPDNLVDFLNESGEDGLLLLLYVEFEVEVEGLYDASSVQTEEVAECISFFKNNGENICICYARVYNQGFAVVVLQQFHLLLVLLCLFKFHLGCILLHCLAVLPYESSGISLEYLLNACNLGIIFLLGNLSYTWA